MSELGEYNQAMRLSDARLCLDCDELHEMEHCPICGSETFAFVIRWVKSAEGKPGGSSESTRTLPPERTEQLNAYRGLLSTNPPRPRFGTVVTGGALGLALLGLARLAWRAIPSTTTGDMSQVAATPTRPETSVD